MVLFAKLLKAVRDFAAFRLHYGLRGKRQLCANGRSRARVCPEIGQEGDGASDFGWRGIGIKGLSRIPAPYLNRRLGWSHFWLIVR